MKKSEVIDVFKFLSSIKINKIANKEIRSNLISNHMQTYKIVKQHDDDVIELQKKLFEGKEEEIKKLNEARTAFSTEVNEDEKKVKANFIFTEFKELLELEKEYSEELQNLMKIEMDVNIKKVNRDDFVTACVEADVDVTPMDLIKLEMLFE